MAVLIILLTFSYGRCMTKIILADRTNGRAIGTVLRLSFVVCNVKCCG